MVQKQLNSFTYLCKRINFNPYFVPYTNPTQNGSKTKINEQKNEKAI